MHRDFTDIEILQRFHESLPRLLENQEGQVEHYFGISLRELIHEFKWQTLVLFKCALLQRKVSKTCNAPGTLTQRGSIYIETALIANRFFSSGLIANVCA